MWVPGHEWQVPLPADLSQWPNQSHFFFKLRLLLKSEIPFPEASQVSCGGVD